MSVKFRDFVDQYLRSPFSGPKKEQTLAYKPRRGSRINTDRFPTSTEVWRHAPPGIFLGFLLPKVPFSGFLSHSDRKFTDYTNHFPDFNLESVKFFYLKYSYN